MIPEEVIAEIKRRADLAAVVGRVVKLKRAGKNLVGLCPFHNEKSPSFNVSPDEGFFYCFGCKAAGDVFNFVERTTGQNFMAVLEQMAAETGVELPQNTVSPEEAARQQVKKKLLRALELSQVFFRTRLSGPEGQVARAYLTDARKIDAQSLDAFGVGYGGASDRGLLDFLTGHGVSVDDAVGAGVLGRSERGAYDFYRHRVTFPIRGSRGEIIAFGGRVFGDQAAGRPKYVNGPQTLVYDKSQVLYGLFEAQPGLKQGKPAVIVEGYFDVVACARAGVPTAVAPCGTSLTVRHVEELARRGERVLVCMDQDKAGKDGAERAILMCLQQGLETGSVELPDKDPDSLVQAGRSAELSRLLNEAPGALDALITKARVQGAGSMKARTAAIDALLPFLAAPRRDLVRAEALRAAAKAFSEDEGLLAAEVERRGRRLLQERLKSARALPPAPPPRAAASTQAPAKPSSPAAAAPSPGAAASSSSAPPRGQAPAARPAAAPKKRAPAAPFTTLERNLCEALICHPQLAPRCRVLLDVMKNDELKGFIERIIAKLVQFHSEPPRQVLLRVGARPDGQVARVTAEVVRDGAGDLDSFLPESTARRIVDDAIGMVETHRLTARLGALQGLLGEADAQGDSDRARITQLLEEQQGLVEILRSHEGPTATAAHGLPAAAGLAGFLGQGPPPEARAASGAAAADPTRPGAAVGPGVDADDDPDDDDEPAANPAPRLAPVVDLPWAGDPEDDPWAA